VRIDRQHGLDKVLFLGRHADNALTAAILGGVAFGAGGAGQAVDQVIHPVGVPMGIV